MHNIYVKTSLKHIEAVEFHERDGADWEVVLGTGLNLHACNSYE